jgi:hypothetical protein
MNPRELVFAALRDDDLRLRQIVKDAKRDGYLWANAPAPDFRGPRVRAVYAGLVELFAARQGHAPPAWTAGVGAAPKPVVLVHAAKKSKAMRRLVERDSPAPLKSRNVLATGQYLDVVGPVP